MAITRTSPLMTVARTAAEEDLKTQPLTTQPLTAFSPTKAPTSAPTLAPEPPPPPAPDTTVQPAAQPGSYAEQPQEEIPVYVPPQEPEPAPAAPAPAPAPAPTAPAPTYAPQPAPPPPPPVAPPAPAPAPAPVAPTAPTYAPQPAPPPPPPAAPAPTAPDMQLDDGLGFAPTEEQAPLFSPEPPPLPTAETMPTTGDEFAPTETTPDEFTPWDPQPMGAPYDPGAPSPEDPTDPTGKLPPGGDTETPLYDPGGPDTSTEDDKLTFTDQDGNIIGGGDEKYDDGTYEIPPLDERGKPPGTGDLPLGKPPPAGDPGSGVPDEPGADYGTDEQLTEEQQAAKDEAERQAREDQRRTGDVSGRVEDTWDSVFGEGAEFGPTGDLMDEQRDQALRQAQEMMSSRGMQGTGAAASLQGDIMRGAAMDKAKANQDFRQQQVQNKLSAASMMFQDSWHNLDQRQQESMAELMLEIERKRKYGDDYDSEMGDYEMQLLQELAASDSLDPQGKQLLNELLSQLFPDMFAGDTSGWDPGSAHGDEKTDDRGVVYKWDEEEGKWLDPVAWGAKTGWGIDTSGMEPST